MSDICESCGQVIHADAVEQEVERVKQWCREVGVVPVLGNCLRQNDCARYLGRATKTLQNWGDGFPSRRLRGRTYVSISDLAQFIVASGED